LIGNGAAFAGGETSDFMDDVGVEDGTNELDEPAAKKQVKST